MISVLIKADGYAQAVRPQNNRTYSLSELQGYVNGHIEIVTLPNNKRLVCNDEGKLQGLPINRFATTLVKDFLQPNDFLVGDVLIIDAKQLD